MDKLRGYFADEIDKNLILKTSYRILRFCSWSKSDTESTLKSIQIFESIFKLSKYIWLLKALFKSTLVCKLNKLNRIQPNDNRDGCTLFNSLSPIRVNRIVFDNSTAMKSFHGPIEIKNNSLCCSNH